MSRPVPPVSTSGEEHPPPTSRGRAAVARWWHSRYGGRLAGEIAIIATLLTLYRLGRMLGRHQSGQAFAHAHQVLALERWLGIDTERGVQQAALGHHSLILLLNRYYASVHFGATMVFLVVVYVQGPKLWAHIRYLFVTVTLSALIIQLVYPLAPPRMLDGYVDTIARYGPAIYDSRTAVGRIANQYAAMPSLHFGWAVLVAYGVVRAFRTPWRWLAVIHPTTTLAAIVITANHYWLDSLVALGLIGAAMALAGAGATTFGGRGAELACEQAET